ncbi:MAG: hypothetical protein FWF29_09805, partial [Treponema sp.]|nr:hypothetical protein [Treponema sp.]
NANTMNDLTKVDTMEKKEQKVLDDLKSKFEEAEKAEWNKIDGKDVPFTTSDAFNQLPIQIDSLKLSAKEKGLIVSVTARKDFTINTPNKDNSYENFGKLYYRILAIDGSIISSGVAGLVSVVHLPKSYKQSGVMDPARISLNISEKPNWANFSSLEFVTTVELK